MQQVCIDKLLCVGLKLRTRLSGLVLFLLVIMVSPLRAEPASLVELPNTVIDSISSRVRCLALGPGPTPTSPELRTYTSYLTFVYLSTFPLRERIMIYLLHRLIVIISCSINIY